MSKDNNFNLNKLKKQFTYHFNKNQHFSNYKKSRNNEEELEEELSKIIHKRNKWWLIKWWLWYNRIDEERWR